MCGAAVKTWICMNMWCSGARYSGLGGGKPARGIDFAGAGFLFFFKPASCALCCLFRSAVGQYDSSCFERYHHNLFRSHRNLQKTLMMICLPLSLNTPPHVNADLSSAVTKTTTTRQWWSRFRFPQNHHGMLLLMISLPLSPKPSQHVVILSSARTKATSLRRLAVSRNQTSQHFLLSSFFTKAITIQ